MAKSYIVYKHTMPNEKVYIGITCQNPPEKRWKNGFGYSKQIVFYNAINKYGWKNIKHEILFTELTKEEAEQKETELIALYKSNQKEYGYNIENGGHVNCVSEETKEKMRSIKLGKQRDEETRRKISEVKKGKTTRSNFHHTEETKEKLRLLRIGKPSWNKGKPRDYETKKKISDKLKGISLSEERLAKLRERSAKKVYKYSINGELVKEYKSISVASVEEGLIKSTLIRRIKNKKIVDGYYYQTDII